jgi:hypothetical protein
MATEADEVDIFLNGGIYDLLGGLMKTEIDDFKASVSIGARNDFRPPVVPIETGFGDKYPGFPFGISHDSDVRSPTRIVP